MSLRIQELGAQISYYREFSKGSRKKYVVNFLDLILLNFLENCGSLHGYEAIKRIKQKFGFNPGTSRIYPTFWKLEEEGLVSSKIVEGKNLKLRKVYEITPKGRVYLSSAIKELKCLVEKLGKESAIEKWYRRALSEKFD